MREFVRDFGITVMLALGLLFGYWAQGCTPQAPPERYGVSSASIVSLARVVQAKPGDEHARNRYAPMCTAFAVTHDGRVQLATAAHCVRATDRVAYFRTWGMGAAHVSWVSVARDVAYLDVSDPELRPLETGPIEVGLAVRSFSTLYDQVSSGRVERSYDEGWYETSQTIVFGWSGAPVVDSLGRAVGVVAKCPTTEEKCTPGHTLVARLE